jgi:hypothetical protein
MLEFQKITSRALGKIMKRSPYIAAFLGPIALLLGEGLLVYVSILWGIQTVNLNQTIYWAYHYMPLIIGPILAFPLPLFDLIKTIL